MGSSAPLAPSVVGCVVFALFGLWMVLTLCTRGTHAGGVRCLGFIVLHLANYTSNCLLMWLFYQHDSHQVYLLTLIPAFCIITCFCTYTALTCVKWQAWKCPVFIKVPYVVIVLGILQGVQIMLAYEDYLRLRQRRQAASRAEPLVDNWMPARFHCKAIEGVVEGTIFGFFAMWTILRSSWQDDGEAKSNFEEWEHSILYACAFFNLLTTGMSLTELDYRSFSALQQRLNQSVFVQVRHLLFRSSEIAFRLLTVLIFCRVMTALHLPWEVSAGVILLDYVMGLLLLRCFGGRDPLWEALFIVGLVLLLVDVMRFVDTPGLSLVAKRITRIMMPIRTLEVIGVVALCWLKHVRLDGDSIYKFLWEEHMGWYLLWCSSCLVYYVMLFSYACVIKPHADLHIAVSEGDARKLEDLLESGIENVDRVGPNGRTPLHLAAATGRTSCITLLVDARADVQVRTADRSSHTALHLAVLHRKPCVVNQLCRYGGDSFLNAVDNNGDTALHMSMRKRSFDTTKELLLNPRVDRNIRNEKGMLPIDCAFSEKFGFDRSSAESAILSLYNAVEARVRDADLMELGSPLCVRPEDQDDSLRGRSKSSSDSPCSRNSLQSGTQSLVSSKWRRSLGSHVPLRPVGAAGEELFWRIMRDQSTVLEKSPQAATDAASNISSFMLTAGMGAMSRAVLRTMDAAPTEEVPTDESVTVDFEDFVEVRKLGAGNFGKVILVRRRTSDELFAMKLMDKQMFKAQKMTGKANSEQYILKTMRHPFIVRLHYAFQGSSFWALVMDYCPNGDLHDMIVNKGNPGLSMKETARYGGEVLLALEHLHASQVIFRDMKPENVIIDANGHANITDFGLSKKMFADAEALTVCGSYGYVAPEVWLGHGYSYSVDMYSFGVTLYMLLSGGEPALRKPNQRVPPRKPAGLQQKLRQAERTQSSLWSWHWGKAIPLIKELTAAAKLRPMAAETKTHAFFVEQLGMPVDSLMPPDGSLDDMLLDEGSPPSDSSDLNPA